MTACPDQRLMLHALHDGELDAGHALALEAHVAGCEGCAGELARLGALKLALDEADLAWSVPAGLQGRVLAALDAEDSAPTAAPARRRRFVSEPWVAGGSMAALAASLVLFAVASPSGAGLPAELVAGHVRSLQARHLVDVETSDRHVVKPWFNGKIDFAPPVIDLADRGYPLAGGRLDYLENRAVAALVYRRRAHVINLFVWPGASPPAPSLRRREGYALIRWGRGGLTYWAVSDIDPADLVGFQKAFAARVGL